MLPDHDPILAKRLELADMVRQAMLRHSTFREAKVERWYNPHDPAHWLWLDVRFPDARESFSLEFFVGTPLSDAVDAEAARVAAHIQQHGSEILPPPPTPVSKDDTIRALEAQNTVLRDRVAVLEHGSGDGRGSVQPE